MTAGATGATETTTGADATGIGTDGTTTGADPTGIGTDAATAAAEIRVSGPTGPG